MRFASAASFLTFITKQSSRNGHLPPMQESLSLFTLLHTLSGGLKVRSVLLPVSDSLVQSSIFFIRSFSSSKRDGSVTASESRLKQT